MRWQRIASVPAALVAMWPWVAHAPTRPPRSPPLADTLPPTTWGAPIVARETDGDACASDAFSDHEPLRERVEEARRAFASSLAPALVDNLGGRVRAASIERGVPAPEFGWPGAHDVRFRATMTMAIRALECEDFDSALGFATRAIASAASDPLAPIVGALAAARLRDPDRERELLLRADRLAPNDRAITRALAIALSTGADLGLALDACDAALRFGPDAELARLRARLGERTRTFAGRSPEIEADLTVVATTSRPDVRPLVRAVDARIAALVGRARRGTLVIYVYPDRASFERATCTTRDAVFDGALHVLAAALDTPRGRSRVEHQAAHAALSTIAPDAPTWLVEGIAQQIARPDASEPHTSDAWVSVGRLGDPIVPITDPDTLRVAYEASLAMTVWLASRPNELESALAQHTVVDGWASGGLAIDDLPDAFPDVRWLAPPAGVVEAARVRSNVAALSDTHALEITRQSAATWLGRHAASCASVATLSDRLVHDPSASVRRACAESLTRLAHADALDALQRTSDFDEDEGVREAAARALSSMP